MGGSEYCGCSMRCRSDRDRCTSFLNPADVSSPTPVLSVAARVVRYCAQAMESQHPYHHEVQPERGKRTSALYGERVVMVDDMDSMLAAFARALTEATGGRAFFLLHQGELPEPLVDTILLAGTSTAVARTGGGT